MSLAYDCTQYFCLVNQVLLERCFTSVMSASHTVPWDELGTVAKLSSNSNVEHFSSGTASPLSQSLAKLQLFPPINSLFERLNSSKLVEL